MSLDRIVCLANSYKRDNRCVAGISLITKHWVRLIGRKVPRCLNRNEARYADGGDASLLDVFEVELDTECGSNYHPEDVQIAGTPWVKVRRFDRSEDYGFLRDMAATGPVLLHGYCDRIQTRKFDTVAARDSLSLLEPDDLWWWIREEGSKRRYRANFRLGKQGRTRYDLPVTDPDWLDQLHLLPTGIHSHNTLCGNRPCETFLTTSLSEPFEGFHYKLVAGVINLPVNRGM